jgi:heme/copper-type cytochrome/quinol oxidase subunit 2
LYSIYNGDSGPVLRQIGLTVFAFSNLITLIFGVICYFAYRFQKNKKNKQRQPVMGGDPENN